MWAHQNQRQNIVLSFTLEIILAVKQKVRTLNTKYPFRNVL